MQEEIQKSKIEKSNPDLSAANLENKEQKQIIESQAKQKTQNQDKNRIPSVELEAMSSNEMNILTSHQAFDDVNVDTRKPNSMTFRNFYFIDQELDDKTAI